MKNQINTSEGNVQFITPDGKLMNVHPSHVYAVFNQDTVSFLLIAMPKSSGLAVFTSTAEDLLFNGETYTFEQLKTVIPEAFAEAGAQARCEIVDELPETGKTNTIYLVPKEEGEGYDEYIYLKDEQRWELVGDTSIEMKNYVKKVDFSAYSAATDAKIDAISGAVSDEASRAISAESALSDSIDALEDYIDTVSGITDTLDGDIDILEESLAQEASARTAADEALSGAISSVTEDVAALSGDVTAHTSNTDIHVTAADKTAWADKYTQAEVDGIVSGLNDSIDAVSGAVADEAARAQSAESALSDSIDALEDYVDEVSGITDTLDGDIDILEESLAQEASARTAADEALSGAISSVTEDVAALSGDVTAHTSNTDIHVTAADKTAWADKYTQAEVDGIVSGLNDSIDAVSGAVADETARAISAETALHDEIENIDLSDYYTKSETSGATELSTAFAAKAELSALTEDERVWAEALTDINGKIGTISGDVDTIEAVLPNKADTSAVTQAVADEATARANADTALSGAVDTALLAYINGAEYVSTAKTINFLNGETVIDSIDATDFIKDGMVSNVEISGGSLVIEFNTDAGKEDIVIPLTDIFDPSNYYTKSQTSGATELATAFSGKLDATAYTPTDLTNYYTKSQTSGATELNTAFDAKQNVLTAGENIVISGDVISAEAGNDVTELTQAEKEALVEAGTVDPDVLYIITDATPINLSNYYQKSETSGATELNTAFNGYVTTGTEQTIRGRKIFTYSDNIGKAIVFKQTSDSNKVGFTIRNTADTDNEVASFEFRPNTFIIDNVSHPLLYFGHYRTKAIGNAGVQQTVIGFRQYDQPNSAAYHMLAPLPEKAKTPFNLRTTFQDFYMPMGFKNGSTMVKADETGVVDLSSIITGGTSINVVQTTGSSTGDVMSQDAVTTALSGKQDALANASTLSGISSSDVTSWDGAVTNASTAITNLGGLKLQQVTQAEYDALATKDASTLYVIVG